VCNVGCIWGGKGLTRTRGLAPCSDDERVTARNRSSASGAASRSSSLDFPAYSNDPEVS
jgi:hypothetical protein